MHVTRHTPSLKLGFGDGARAVNILARVGSHRCRLSVFALSCAALDRILITIIISHNDRFCKYF